MVGFVGSLLDSTILLTIATSWNATNAHGDKVALLVAPPHYNFGCVELVEDIKILSARR